MKTRKLIAVVIALSAFATGGLAFADQRSEDPIASSSKSRAEVMAEFEKARAEGMLMQEGGRDDLNAWTGAHGVAGSRYSSLTREEVRAETIEHLKNYNPATDELYGR